MEEIPLILKDTYDFTIITARLRHDLPRKDQISGIPVFRIGLGLPIDKWIFPFLVPIACRKFRPDIVHAVLESFAGLALVFCRWSVPRASRILTCQSTNTSLLVGMMHRSADRITVLSAVLKERAKKFGRSDAVIVPNGIHVKSFPEREKVSGRILFAGRLEPMKGVDTLLDAFAIVIKHVPHAHLRIVGNGSLRESLSSRHSELVERRRVIFAGFVPVPNVYEEFSKAEIFCGLSRHEAFGNVFLEAQAAGCAVIGTNLEGIPDIVRDGETGVLVPKDDPDAAAKAMITLLQDNGLRMRLASAGKESAKGFDWPLIAQKYAEIYEELDLD